VAPKKKAPASDKAVPTSGSSRTDRLLAILVLEAIGKKSDQEKAVLLSAAGFKNPEVADLLGTTTPTVNQHLYASRKAKAAPKKKPTKKPSTATKKRR
jgi:DNA-binding CsgD family transcriptional regulator